MKLYLFKSVVIGLSIFFLPTSQTNKMSNKIHGCTKHKNLVVVFYACCGYQLSSLKQFRLVVYFFRSEIWCRSHWVKLKVLAVRYCILETLGSFLSISQLLKATHISLAQAHILHLQNHSLYLLLSLTPAWKGSLLLRTHLIRLGKDNPRQSPHSGFLNLITCIVPLAK